jgi:hypothetical protein
LEQGSFRYDSSWNDHAVVNISVVYVSVLIFLIFLIFIIFLVVLLFIFHSPFQFYKRERWVGSTRVFRWVRYAGDCSSGAADIADVRPSQHCTAEARRYWA